MNKKRTRKVLSNHIEGMALYESLDRYGRKIRLHRTRGEAYAKSKRWWS